MMTSQSSEHDIGSSSSTEPATVGRSLHSDKVIVGAIDFGTTYSGYAYSQRDDFNKDPTKVQKLCVKKLTYVHIFIVSHFTTKLSSLAYLFPSVCRATIFLHCAPLISSFLNILLFMFRRNFLGSRLVILLFSQ